MSPVTLLRSDSTAVHVAGHVIVPVGETIDVEGLTLEQLFRVEWRQAASEKGHQDFNDLRPLSTPEPMF